MNEQPLIYTTKGNLAISELDQRVVWTDNADETICASVFWQGDECVRRETLAAGAMLLSELDPGLEVVVFDSHAGALIVRSTPEGYTLDLPRRQRTPWTPDDSIEAALGGVEIVDAFIGEYANVVVEDEATLRGLKPDFAALNVAVRGPRQGMIGVTAPADERQPYDFVSRFFCPGVGIDEDPVTGSSFADLAPYWCDRFDLESVVGFQASKRGGYMRAIQTLSSVRLLG